MLLRPGLHRGPHWGSSQRSPDLLAGLDGHILAEWKKEGRNEGIEGKGLQKRRRGKLAAKWWPGSALLKVLPSTFCHIPGD